MIKLKVERIASNKVRAKNEDGSFAIEDEIHPTVANAIFGSRAEAYILAVVHPHENGSQDIEVLGMAVNQDGWPEGS